MMFSPKRKQQMYVVKKYVMATDAADVIRKEKTTPISDIWIDEDWRKNQVDRLENAIGFIMPPQQNGDF